MAEPRLSMTADDDLPRTLRREKEARDREARQLENTAGPVHYEAGDNFTYEPAEPYQEAEVTVGYLNIPFFHMMAFFIKAAIAAIPALIMLAAVTYGMLWALGTLFPTVFKSGLVLWLPDIG